MFSENVWEYLVLLILPGLYSKTLKRVLGFQAKLISANILIHISYILSPNIKASKLEIFGFLKKKLGIINIFILKY